MVKIYKITVLLLLVGLGACTYSPYQKNEVIEKGRVSMSLSSKSDINYPNTGDGIDLTQIPQPNPNEFAIVITSEGDTTEKYDNYAQMPKILEMPIGQYKLSATYGEKLRAGWNTVYYAGEKEFILSSSANEANLQLQCDLKNSFAFAKFDDKFKAAFRDVTIEFATEYTRTPLEFSENETRIACFRESQKLWVTVNATMKADGKKYTYGIDPVFGVKAGDLNVFNFTMQNGTVAFNLTVDNGVNVVEKNVELIAGWIDGRFTKMYLTYDQTNPVLFVSGMKSNKNYDVVISTNVGLQNLFLNFDPEFAAEIGFEKVDMLNLTTEQKKIIDEKVGVVLGVNQNNDGYRLSLSGCKDKLLQRNGAVTNYKFEVEYVDNSENTEKCLLEIVMIEIKADQFNSKRVWSRFAYVPAPYIVGADVTAIIDLPFEYWIKEGEGEWKSMGIRNDKNEAYIDNLKPMTNYQTKVMFEGFVVSESAFATMPEIFIENGGFEDNQTFTYAGRAARVGAEFTNWISTNAVTTMTRSNDQYYKSYPSVRLTDGRSGKGALIQTVGWGESTVYQHWTNMWGTTGFNKTRNQAMAGKLSFGDETGIEFNALPNKMTFYYSYLTKQNTNMIGRIEVLAGNEIIGVGEFVSNVNDELVNKQETFIKYKQGAVSGVNGVVKKPTHVKVWFSSNSVTATTADLNDNDGSIRSSWSAGKTNTVNVWDARYEGSTLVIDDVELVYPSNINEYTFE